METKDSMEHEEGLWCLVALVIVLYCNSMRETRANKQKNKQARISHDDDADFSQTIVRKSFLFGYVHY
jgi:hypothetical protein